jgi:hypothetical protein
VVPYEKTNPSSAVRRRPQIEVAVQVFGLKIVWIAGPEGGSVHDIEVLQKNGLVRHLGESEVLLGDLGYVGEIAVVTPEVIWPKREKNFFSLSRKSRKNDQPSQIFQMSLNILET